jgi:arginase
MHDEARVIGVPNDFGSNRRGVDMGPSAIRYADLLAELEAAGVDVTDAGDVRVPHLPRRDDGEDGPVENARHLDEVAEVTTALADTVADCVGGGELPVLLGGDHSLSIGSLAGTARDADVGVVWFDAHGDLNTPSTSPSGNVHGMPLAAALGLDEFAEMDWAAATGVSEENVAFVGLRALDDAEKEVIRNSEMTAFTMSDVDERGVGPVVADALDAALAGVDDLHVSLDMDWLDPGIAPGVGTPVRGGVTYREAHAAMEAVAARDDADDILRSFEVVEVNPVLDESNETADLAAELTASALGKRIL